MNDLQRRVYRELLKVPRGKVTTYGDLARAAGIKNGQRAIGQMMNKNPFPVIIPCHRVVKSDGNIGGYFYGQNVKTKMLHNEGINVKNGKIQNLEKAVFRF